MRDVYPRIWGQYLHYGWFPRDKRVRSSVSFDTAARRYTERLAATAVTQMPIDCQVRRRVKVLEVGCGKGECYEVLDAIGLRGEYTGVDLMEEHAAAVRAKAAHAKSLSAVAVVDDVESFLDSPSGPPGNSLDLVICEDAFYQIINKGVVLEKLVEALRPGGILAVSDLAASESLSESRRWQEDMPRRQGNSMVLTFRRAVKSTNPDRRRYGESLWFEFPGLLPAERAQVLLQRDVTEQLAYTYEVGADVAASAADLDKSVRERIEGVFRRLARDAAAGEFRLIWWFVVKRCPDLSGERELAEGEVLALEIGGAGYRRGPQAQVLDRMRLGIRAGEYVGLLGKTGAGKTTLLEAMAGLLPPDRAVAVKKARADLRIALVPQHPALFADVYVSESLRAVYRAAEGSAGAMDEELARIAYDCDLEKVLASRCGQLSGGQRQRVALAMALARLPDVLLLDEPLSAQDQMQRERIRRLLERIRTVRPTLGIVHVTHRWEDIEDAATSRYEISGGQLLRMEARTALPATSA